MAALSRPKLDCADVKRLADSTDAVAGVSRNGVTPDDVVDLDAERMVLSELIESDNPDPAHPLFSRYQRYMERCEALERERGLHLLRQEADVSVALSDAAKLSRMGQLSSDGGDRMRLHTRDAMRLFLGRVPKPGEKGYAMAGGKRVAAALRALWSLSANDNPYADWALVEVDDRISALRQTIESEQRHALAGLDAMRQKGLDYTILQSRDPAEVALGFASPYGYMIAGLLVEVDFLVRVIKSAVLRDLIGSENGREGVHRVKHKCLSVFHFAVRWQNVLSRPEFAKLSRLDLLPNAAGQSTQRAEALSALLGPVPQEILSLEKQPRHSKRRLPQVSDAELKLLSGVPLSETAGALVALVQ